MFITSENIKEIGFRKVCEGSTFETFETLYRLGDDLNVVEVRSDNDGTVTWHLVEMVDDSDTMYSTGKRIVAMDDIVKVIEKKKKALNKVIMDNIQRYADLSHITRRINEYCDENDVPVIDEK